jgi:ribosomal protein S18 acetylase RimI-like enzyme
MHKRQPISDPVSREAGVPETSNRVEIELRTFQHEDFETLFEIDQACYESDTAYSRSDLRAYLGFLGAECVVAELKGSATAKGDHRGTGTAGTRAADRIIGFCISAHREREGYIITIDVLKEYRRNGIGSMLLDQVERRLANAGVRRVGLETATENAAGVAFWRKHGYRTRGVRKGYYPRGRDAYSMTKQIADSEAGKS